MAIAPVRHQYGVCARSFFMRTALSSHRRHAHPSAPQAFVVTWQCLSRSAWASGAAFRLARRSVSREVSRETMGKSIWARMTSGAESCASRTRLATHGCLCWTSQLLATSPCLFKALIISSSQARTTQPSVPPRWAATESQTSSSVVVGQPGVKVES